MGAHSGELRTPGQHRDLLGEAARVGHVVRIDASDQAARAQLAAGPERLGQADAVQMNRAHALVVGGPALQQRRCLIARAIVHRDHLEVAMGLKLEAADRLRQMLRRVAAGQQHGE